MDEQNTTTSKEESHAQKSTAPLFGVTLALLFATAAFFSGMEVGTYRAPHLQNAASLGSLFASKDKKENVDMAEFWRVWDLLDKKFVSSTTTAPANSQKKIDGAIAGMVSALGDPYTVYFPKADAEVFNADIAGNFSGVGMEIGIQKDLLTVIAPLPESPAEKGGIRSGDILVKIDGVSTEGMAVDQAVKKIRGEKGTKVKLTIARQGGKDFMDIEVVRDTINIPSSKVEEKNGVYVVHLYNFSAQSEQNMEKALRGFMTSGKNKLVIDLRGNPGGYLQSAVKIASYFLPVGKVVVRESYGPNIPEDIYRSEGRDLHPYRDFKTVVLIDRGSASASEILAGALHEQGVATLMGDTSFGKGSVQELVQLDSGASLKVTIARWLTPNGHSISHSGLDPDIKVDVTEDDRKNGKDPQLDAAIQFLNK